MILSRSLAKTVGLAVLIILTCRPALAQAPRIAAVRQVETMPVHHRGREALRVIEAGVSGEDRMAILAGPDFKDGEITLWLSGERGPRAGPTDRGFVGIAFRIGADAKTFEGVYLRPENARADDQLRRNRTVQYHSPPTWTWQRLRTETPALYETYADMEPGAWTKLRLVVRGDRAVVHVGEATQPTLIVNGLKRGPDASGPVGLWVGPGTVAHSAKVEVRPAHP